MARRVFLLTLQPRKTLRVITSRHPHGKNNETLGDHGSDYVAGTVETLGGASTGI